MPSFQEVGILIDSALDVDKDIRNLPNLKVVPVYVNFGDISYKDRVEISIAKFFDEIKSNSNWPTTSQPSPGDFYEAYSDFSKDYKEIYSFHVSSRLSGTIQSAQIAANQIMEENPDVKIHLINTKSVSVGGQIIIEKFQQLLQTYKEYPEFSKELQEFINSMEIYLALHTLEYLIRGGRLSKPKGFLARIMGYQALLIIKDGIISPFDKARGFENCVKLAEKNAFKSRSADETFSFAVAHVNEPETAKQYLETLSKNFPNAKGKIVSIGPALSAHSGPRAMAFLSYNI